MNQSQLGFGFFSSFFLSHFSSRVTSPLRPQLCSFFFSSSSSCFTFHYWLQRAKLNRPIERALASSLARMCEYVVGSFSLFLFLFFHFSLSLSLSLYFFYVFFFSYRCWSGGGGGAWRDMGEARRGPGSVQQFAWARLTISGGGRQRHLAPALGNRARRGMGKAGRTTMQIKKKKKENKRAIWPLDRRMNWSPFPDSYTHAHTQNRERLISDIFWRIKSSLERGEANNEKAKRFSTSQRKNKTP